jgi:hypothetical protein
LFHASIESSYNLFLKKFIVRMTQIMWRRFFENKLKEKGGNICLSLEDEKLRFKGFWRLKGR